MKSIYFVLLSIFCTANVFCQNEEIELRLENLPYYTYGKGLGITSPDSLFQLNIRFRIQNRFSYFKNEDEEYYYEGQVRRLRLRFDGFVGSPSFIYVLQLSFAPGDVGQIEEGENINIIRDAMIFYKFNKKWQIGFGQTKLPGNRQRINSSGALQLADRTINNARFNIDRDFGWQINFLNEKLNKPYVNFRGAISMGEGRNFTRIKDKGLAYTGKLEFFPLGSFKKDGVFFEGDLIREPKPKVMISISKHFNDNAIKEMGILGDDLYEARDMSNLFIESVIKYRGFAFMTAFMNRTTPQNPITTNLNGDIKYIYVGSGHDFQGSYVFKNNFELIGRFSTLKPNKSILSFAAPQKQFTIGITKYFWEHTFKIQTEATIDQLNPKDKESKENLLLRFQIEMGI